MASESARVWEYAPLSKIIDTLDGGVSVKSGDGPARIGNVGVLKVSAVAYGMFYPAENKVVEGDEVKRLRVSVKAGDLIISRANTADLVGACGIARHDYPTLFLPDKLWKVSLRDNQRDSIEWLNLMMSSPVLRAKLRTASSGTGRAMKNISKPSLLRIGILRPPFNEQCQIVAVLSDFLTVEVPIQELLGLKRQRLHGLLRQLLTGRRRLPAFVDQPWDDVRFCKVTRECSERNAGVLGIDRVMAVNKTHGLIPMRERTIASDLNRYKIVRPGAFAYNPMRINIGSIARSHFSSDVLVSPDYVVFECTECDPRYLDLLRRSEIWRKHILIAGNGSVRVRIYYGDLASMKLRLPGLQEQKAIAELLGTAQREIDLLEQLREQIQIQKRGLMQKLLTGQIRVPTAQSEPADRSPA